MTPGKERRDEGNGPQAADSIDDAQVELTVGGIGVGSDADRAAVA